MVSVGPAGPASCTCSPGLRSRMVPQDLAGPEQLDCSPVLGCCRHGMEHECSWSCRCAGAERGGRSVGQESTLSQNEGFPHSLAPGPTGFPAADHRQLL